jgi:hypothetical protein
MADLINQSFARGEGAKKHMVSTEEPHKTLKNGALMLPVKSSYFQHRRCKTSTINPNSQPVQALESGGFCDFRISSSDNIRSLVLALKLTCSATFDATPVPWTTDNIFGLLSHIELLAENGSLSVQRIEADHLKLALSNLHSEAYYAVKNGIQGSNGVDDTPASLDASESATSYIPIFGAFLSDFEMPVSGFNSPVIVRVWFKSGSYIYSTSLQNITNASLMVDQWAYDTSVRQKTMNKFLNSKLDFRFASTRFQKSIETVTPNQMQTVRLSSLHGLITSAVVQLKLVSSGSTKAIKRADILDSSGASLLGGAPLEHAYLQATQRAREGRYVNSDAESDPASNRFFHIPIGEMSVQHNQEGSVGAYIPMSGQHQLSFEYESDNDTAVSMEITVLYTSVSTFTVDKGVCSVQHS